MHHLYARIRNLAISLTIASTLLWAQSSGDGLNGEDLLAMLRSFDQALLRRQTLVSEIVEPKSWENPGEGQKRTTITLTTNDGAVAVEREISYMSPPRYLQMTKQTESDYDKFKNMLVWRTTRRRNLLESDFQAHQTELLLARVSPDGDFSEEEGAPIVDLYRPSDSRTFLDFARPLWAAGRGFADSLTRISEVNQTQEGLIRFRATGTFSPLMEGTWDITVEPGAAYLVRSASFTLTGKSSPTFVCATNGTKWSGGCCLAEEATLTSAPGPLENNIITAKTRQLKPEADHSLFAKLRGILRNPLPKDTEVFDYRPNPDSPFRYRVGELPMTNRELLALVADANPNLADTDRIVPQKATSGADPNTEQKSANERHLNAQVTTRHARRHVIIALALLVIAVLTIGAVHAGRTAGK